VLDELVARKHLTRVPGEGVEEPELERRQTHGQTAAEH
jgi:hypothetical protein